MLDISSWQITESGQKFRIPPNNHSQTELTFFEKNSYRTYTSMLYFFMIQNLLYWL